MTPKESKRFKKLYNKFLQALALQGLAKSTIDCYARGVRKVAEYFDCCPDTRLSKDDLKGYFADLLTTHSWSTIKLHLNGLKQFWQHALKRGGIRYLSSNHLSPEVSLISLPKAK